MFLVVEERTTIAPPGDRSGYSREQAFALSLLSRAAACRQASCSSRLVVQ
jgi:hypothetical protein